MLDLVTWQTYQRADRIPASTHAQARALMAASMTRHDACWRCHAPVRRVETPDGRTLLIDTLVTRDGPVVFIERGWVRELAPGEMTSLDRYVVHRCPAEGDAS